MSEKKDDLISVPLDFLSVGMECPSDILNFDKKIVLLRKGDILDETRILRLRKFNAGQVEIHMPEESYEILSFRQKETRQKSFDVKLDIDMQIKREVFEKEMGYSELKDAVSDLLENVKSATVIKRSDLASIQNRAAEQVLNRDIGRVLQCLNAPAPVSEQLQRHCVNVGIINGLIGKWLGLAPVDISLLVLTGVAHDLGMAKIPPEIINAPRKLNQAEMMLVKHHTQYTHDLLFADSNYDQRVIEAAKYHHERTDGKGYPDQKVGDEIPAFARITAVSDIYNAMISERAYRRAFSPLEVLRQFADNEIKGVDKTISTLLVQKMPTLFIGKEAILSNGTKATITNIMSNDILHPIVVQDGVYFQLSDTLKCDTIIFATE